MRVCVCVFTRTLCVNVVADQRSSDASASGTNQLSARATASQKGKPENALVVLCLDVFCKRGAVTVEFKGLARADEALGFHRLLSSLLLVSKLRERVDDNTEHHVETNNRDQNEETEAQRGSGQVDRWE